MFAVAHVRGGGELGRRWYEEGKLRDKPHTFTDFVGCAHHLVDAGFTTPAVACRPRRLRRRAVDRGGGKSRAGAVPRPRRRGAVRRLPDDDAGRLAPAHRRRMGGMGEPAGRSRGLRRHALVLALRQRARITTRRHGGPVPGHPGHRRPERQPGRLLGARQMGRPPAHRPTVPIGSSCEPSSAPVTAGRLAVTTHGGTRLW